MQQFPTVVIGAGIVGVSTAIWLQRLGREVLLLDRDTPGQAASFGNSGLLAAWAVAPVTSPSLWREAPRYLVDPDGPLFMRWSHLPKMAPWMLKFLSHATDKGTRRIVDAISGLVGDTVEQHKSLVRGTALEHWVRDSKCGFAYPSLRAFEADHYSWDMKRQAGIMPTVLTGAEVREEEPILGPSIQCLAMIEGQGHITDPGGYVAALARYFEAQGGRLVRAEVTDMALEQGRIARIKTSVGSIDCEAAVLTAGIWSKDLMRKLGLSVPMEAERGYHVIYENPSAVPRNPLLMAEGKFGVNAMDMGLRFAGTVELGGHHAGPRQKPIEMIKRHVSRAFPDLTCSGTQEWMGFRPTPADSTPLIGEIGQSGIFAGFGHQHVGLTAGPKTGRLIAQIIAGNTPNFDMTAYDPNRFT